MIYYQFNRQELSKKAKDRYHNRSVVKKNAAEYYIAIKDVLKEKGKNNYKILSEKKDAKRKYSRNR